MMKIWLTYIVTKINRFNCIDNEYVVLKNSDGEFADILKYESNNGFKRISKKTLKTSTLGELKPKDIYQQMAIDSLLHDDITVLSGKAGSGKTLLSLMAAMYLIENNKYSKLIVMFNPTSARGAENWILFW